MFGIRNPKMLQSGTVDYPTAKHLFDAVIEELTISETWTWAHFQNKKSVAWAEVAVEKEAFLVNFSFPFKKPLDVVFLERRIQIPETWKLDYFKKKKAATFRVARNEKNAIVPFLDLLFTILYQLSSDYIISGSLN